MSNVNKGSIMPIDIPFPESGPYQLKLRIGGSRLTIAPADADDRAWVSGTYDDPSGVLPCQIETRDGSVFISQETNFQGLTDFMNKNKMPTFNLRLGKGKSYELTIESGANQASIDLGGLPITKLVGRHGAGKCTIDFSEPNPAEMSQLELAGGALGVEVRNLGNANFAEMRYDGGASSSSLDFGGSPRRDGRVRVTTGVSSVEIAVPTTTAARISTESVLGHLDIGDGFMKKEGAFWTEAALANKLPLMTIHATVALGLLRLRTRAVVPPRHLTAGEGKPEVV